MPHVLLVDFKYDGEKATIVEFGCGLNSSYTGYDAIHPKQEYLMYARIYEKLAQKYDKIIFVAQYANILKSILVHTQLKSHQFHITDSSSYRGLGRVKFNKTETIVKEVQNLIAQKKTEEKFCVVVCAVESSKAFVLASALKRDISRTNVDIINSNTSVASLAKNKFMYAYFGGKDHVATEIIDLQNISKTKLKVASQFKKIVLKPTDGSGGNGVKVITEENLIHELNLIKFLNDFKEPIYKIYEHLPPLEEQHRLFGQPLDFSGKDNGGWLGIATCHFALLQQYQAGELIEGYNPTGRMVFIVSDDLTEIDFIDGYWKLPPQKFNSTIDDHSQQYVSDVHPANQQAFSLPITEVDKKAIQISLTKPIFSILKQATQKSLEQHLKDIKSNADQDVCNYGLILENSFKKFIFNKQEQSPIAEFENPLSQSAIIIANSIWEKSEMKTELCNPSENNVIEQKPSTM